MSALLKRFDREVAAIALRDVLAANGIHAAVHQTDGGYEVHVREGDLGRARELLVSVGRGELQGGAIPPGHAAAESAMDLTKMGPVTIALLAISIGLTIYTGYGMNLNAAPFHFAELIRVGDRIVDINGYAFINEPWRLITPIFLHGNVIHIFFNGWWIKDLGAIFERVFSSWKLLIFTLVVAALSNAGEFFIGKTPLFGGLSGLLYGLFGYLWIRGAFDPYFPVRLRRAVVVMLLVWFVVCAIGFIPNIANWAHGIGLLIGMIWAYFESGDLSRRFGQPRRGSGRGSRRASPGPKR